MKPLPIPAALSYKEALQAVRRAGAANAEGDALLAQHCSVLAPQSAISPVSLYEACKASGIDAAALLRIAHDPVAVANVVFDSWNRGSGE